MSRPRRGLRGSNMVHHLAHFGRAVGLDNNERPLSVARQRGLDVRRVGGEDLPFEDSEFDLVALLDTVEHVPDKLETAVFAECWRVLKPRGKLLITAPAFMWLLSHNDVLNAHSRRYAVGELRHKLDSVGFRTLRSSTATSSFSPWPPCLSGYAEARRSRLDLASPHFNKGAYQVEMEPAPALLNMVLNALGWLETQLLKLTSLPVGTGIVLVAEKRPGVATQTA